MRSGPHLRRSPFGRSAAALQLLLLLGVAASGLAAEAARGQAVRRLEAGFERDVNRYGWTADAQVAQRVGRWDVNLLNRFASDAYVFSGGRLSFRDENLLDWRVDRPLGTGLSTRLRGQAAWFSQGRVFSQDVYAGLRFRPRDFLMFEPALGLAWDQRPGVARTAEPAPLRMDAGPAYGARFELTPPPLEGYVLQLQGEGMWKVINPRRAGGLRLAGAAERAFGRTRLSATAGLSRMRRDAYQAISFLNREVPAGQRPESVEATTSDTLLLGLQLESPLLWDLHVMSRVDFSAASRLVRTLHAPQQALFFDTDFDRQAVEAEAALVYDRPRLTARLVVQTGAEVERRQLVNREHLPPTQAAQKSSLLEQADYDRGFFSLLARTRAALGPRLVLTFDGRASILRHDTPAANLDDRDELYHHAQLGLMLPLSRYVQAEVKLLGTFYHTVYLNALRSAENNVQRSLRLQPTVRWTPSGRTRLEVGSEVRATYTVDDFVLPGRRSSDQSARELRYLVDAEHDFGGGLRLLGSGSLSDLHLGRLLWDRFAEIPFDTLRTYSGWVRLQAGQRIVSEVGFRFFIRSDFERAANVQYTRPDAGGEGLQGSITRPGRTWIEQAGPTFGILWPMYGGSVLRLDGWLNAQHIHRRLYGEMPEGSADAIRRAARRGTRQVIPNVALSILWNL